jgi:hypothetical protein
MARHAAANFMEAEILEPFHGRAFATIVRDHNRDGACPVFLSAQLYRHCQRRRGQPRLYNHCRENPRLVGGNFV